MTTFFRLAANGLRCRTDYFPLGVYRRQDITAIYYN